MYLFISNIINDEINKFVLDNRENKLRIMLTIEYRRW